MDQSLPPNQQPGQQPQVAWQPQLSGQQQFTQLQQNQLAEQQQFFQQQPQLAGQQQFVQQQEPQLSWPQVGYQTNLQTVFIQTVPRKPYFFENFDGKKSFIFGITIVILAPILLILNGIGFWLQIEREYDVPGNYFLVVMPASWSFIFACIAGGFAIGAGKSKTRCFIITTLVMSIIASFVTFLLFAVTVAGLWYDSYTFHNKDGERKQVEGSMAVTVFMVVLSLTKFVLLVWCAVLSGRVVCKNNEQNLPIPAPGQTMLVQFPQAATSGASGGTVAVPVDTKQNLSA